MKRHSKRYKEAAKIVDEDKVYPLKEAVALLKKMPAARFVQSVDVALYLNIDTKDVTQNVRGTVVLPHGMGKVMRVLVFCKGEMEKEARSAGADFVGAQDIIDKISAGWLDFDVAVSSPDMMRDVSRLGKILGPRGLMPSPKAGTVTKDIARAVQEIKAGKVEFKADKQAGVHSSVGRISFDEDKIYENASKFIDAILAAKPSAAKGEFIKSASISTTMGPGVRIWVN
ncbi:MAG: 50S ribosomal protein L1 [Candidatus Omnitrophota bacterium]